MSPQLVTAAEWGEEIDHRLVEVMRGDVVLVDGGVGLAAIRHELATRVP